MPRVKKIWAMSTVVDSHGVLARKAAALQSNKGKGHSSTAFSASFLGSLSCPLIHLIPIKHLYYSLSLQSVPRLLTWQLLNRVIFPHNRTDQFYYTSMKPTGIWVCSWQEAGLRNQMSFLLRSAGVGRKETQKKKILFNRPHPDLAKIKNMHSKAQTLTDRLTW